MNSIETAPKTRPIWICFLDGERVIVSYRRVNHVEIDEEGNESTSDDPWEYWVNVNADGSYPEDKMPIAFDLEKNIIGWEEIE